MLTFVLRIAQIFVKPFVQLDITSDNKGLLIPRMDFESLDVSLNLELTQRKVY